MHFHNDANQATACCHQQQTVRGGTFAWSLLWARQPVSSGHHPEEINHFIKMIVRVLSRLGLSLDNVEMVLRYGLTMALEASEASGMLTPEDRPSFLATSHRNMQRMKEIDPTSAWSCVCAAKVWWSVTGKPQRVIQVCSSCDDRTPYQEPVHLSVSMWWQGCSARHTSMSC